MTERSDKVTLDNLVVFQRGELNMETVIIERPATVSDLVEALQAEGVGWEVAHTKMGPWMKWDGDEYDYVLLPLGDYWVVPLGEDA